MAISGTTRILWKTLLLQALGSIDSEDSPIHYEALGEAVHPPHTLQGPQRGSPSGSTVRVFWCGEFIPNGQDDVNDQEYSLDPGREYFWLLTFVET